MSKKSLSKKIQDILSTATPKQKALLVCKQYRDHNTMGEKTLLTEDEVNALRDSLKTNEEKIEYNKWINVYNVYSEFTPFIGLVYKEYQARAEKLLGYLRRWEDYEQEENHLITIYEGLKETGSKGVEEAFFTSLSHLHFIDAKLVISKTDGYPEIDIETLYEKIKDEAKSLFVNYSIAKAVVVVLEEYTKKTRSKDFRPDVMIGAIEDIKEDYALRVAPKYSRKLLQEKIDKGMRITNGEQKRAVYPSYDELQPTEDEFNLCRKRLNDIIAIYARR